MLCAESPGSHKYTALLELAFNTNERPVRLINTGFIDKSSDGVNWLRDSELGQKMLASPSGYAAILVLGSNDCFGMQLDKSRANLESMLASFSSKNIPVIVVGTTPYAVCQGPNRPNYSADYIQMFSDLADQFGDLYYRDFKDGVIGHPDLLQGDGDHPNFKGEAIIAEKMLPVVTELVARATHS